MFKKSASKCVQVRVRGNDEAGYIAEYCLYPSRLFPFLNAWNAVRTYYTALSARGVYPTFEHAQKAAISEYEQWIEYFTQKAEKEKQLKAYKRAGTIWRHP